ncbi:MAG: restriction endonuclease [Burkholderiales bacterium]|nr:restriction endonuclease [Burkholderiales bacterium]
MSNYDFRQLNDKEFEGFCTDLLGVALGCRIERFKPGRDSGVDGRYFSSSGNEVILQCKHWSNTPIGSLIRELEKSEKPKLDKLKPKKYLLAVSNPLSRSDKKKIFGALSPYISSEGDIYGKEDLNDLLNKYTEVERRHYKLWLHSASVLSHIFNSALIGRSRYSLEEIIHSSRMYAITSNHDSALNILEKLRVLIISGDPGVGKTTLANHLCLKYVAEGYEYYKISDEIKEVELVFNSSAKQIFYFDDFLGRNYLDALRGHEGSQVTQFIRRVSANKNMRFVLTSRSTILNQGKFLIDNFEHDNLKRNEFELRIKSLSEIDKAKILYNHIYHSGIESNYVEQLYIDRRYRSVISHRNFNPRLINYITDPTRLETCAADNYWQYVVASLNDPSQIWENPFGAQLDDFGRVLVLLVVLHGYAIHESQLAEAYQRFVSLPSSQSLQGMKGISD